MSNWDHVGNAPVDAGHVIIIDSCYLIDDNASMEKWYKDQICTDANEWSPRGFKPIAGVGQLRGQPLGVAITSGYGDGFYPVYIKKAQDGRVQAAMVVFDGEVENQQG